MKKCLVIDNKQIMRKVIIAQLSVLGIETIESSNAKNALEICTINIPDLIVVDWLMPITDGIEFIKQFKEQFPKAKPLMVVYSAKQNECNEDNALKNGADIYIQKPITLKNLKIVLEKFSVI